MVILKNTRKQRFVFSLYHDKVCRRDGRCGCQKIMVPQSDGRRRPVYMPVGVQIGGNSESAPLPDAVMHVPQVQAALRPGGFLQRREVTESELASWQAQLVKQQLEANRARRDALTRAAFGGSAGAAVEAAPAAAKPKTNKPKKPEQG